MILDVIQPNLAMFIRPLRLVSSGWTGHVPFGAWLTAVHVLYPLALCVFGWRRTQIIVTRRLNK